MSETTREELDRLHAESKKTGDYISLAVAIDKHWPAMSARLVELEADELKAIEERDEWSDLFDKICVYLGVETEYSNLRSADDVLVECGERIGELLAVESSIPARDAELANARKALALAPTPDDYALMAISLSGQALRPNMTDHIAAYRVAYNAAMKGGV